MMAETEIHTDGSTRPMARKNVLIAGARSYVGTSFAAYAQTRYPHDFAVSAISLRDDSWRQLDFSDVDTVFYTVGIAHIKETDDNRHLYYEVNRDLTVEFAGAAKKAGVRQFIMMSSMSVYGCEVGHITKDTPPAPKGAYGCSKLEADELLAAMQDESFRVAILRPPMIYGRDCKGNYRQLEKFAGKSPLFPKLPNERSMLYIGNLCEFVCGLIREGGEGLFFPQNQEYVCTYDMVCRISQIRRGKMTRGFRILNPLIRVLPIHVCRKVFGSLTYEKTDTVNMFVFEESIRLSELPAGADTDDGAAPPRTEDTAVKEQV